MYNKFMFFNNNKIYYLIIFSFILLTFSALFFYLDLNNSDKRLKTVLLNQASSQIDNTLSNIIDDMIIDNPNFIEKLLSNESLRVSCEKSLNHLDNENIKSLYVLFKRGDKLFFLMDTADEDRGDVADAFIPEDGSYKSFQKVLRSRKKELVIQTELNLGFTLIKPMIENNKVIGVLVVDYTQNSLNLLFSSFSIQSIGIALLTFILMLFGWIFYIFRMDRMKYKLYYNVETNTYNRIYLTDKYERIPFSKYYIALADLDFFKRINNLYGQKSGNQVITTLILNMNGLLRKDDKFIQYSGEEFLLLISKENRTIEEFKELLEELRISVEKTKFFFGKERVSLTISMGALIHTELEKSLQDTIHKADTALYQSKHKGRNRISYFDLSQRKKLNREKLKGLIESDKLTCYYQAIVSLKDGSVNHYEALLRIEDGEEILFPDRILPDLEDSYLYSYLTKKIIEFNVEKLRMDSKIKIAINLSADDLINDAIISLLAQNADVSERLLIEILETKSINYSKVEHSIQRLKFLGYQICIDDFGSGFSNITHLLNLSIDFLKIDGAIIKKIQEDRRAYSIVKTFADFCLENEIKMVAEFIDTKEIVDILKECGVEYGQGWYFAKALPYEELDREEQ